MSQPRKHYIQQGFQICLHTCKPDGCHDGKGSLLWKKEGSSLRRHAFNSNIHANCTQECPGFHLLNAESKKIRYWREPTAQELRLHGPSASDPVPKDAETKSDLSNYDRASTPGSENVTVDLNADLVEPLLPTRSISSGETYRVIYVQDPTRSMNRTKAENDLAFLRTTVSETEYKAIERLEGSVHFLSQGRNGYTVLMQEWLCVMIRLQRYMHQDTRRHRFSIVYLPWEKFLKIMLDPGSGKETWMLLREADYLIGGVDTSLSYLDTAYNLTAENIKKFNKAMKALSKEVYIWPPPNQIETVGSKLTLINHLDMVAGRSTKTARPNTRLLLPDDRIPKQIVLKRTHSDSGEHVIFPGDNNRNWEHLRSQSNIPNCQWFGQTFISTLRTLGEWRVFFVGGRIIYVIHSVYNERKGSWKWERVHDYYSLDEFSDMKADNRLDGLKKVANPTEGNLSIRKKAEQEFIDFAQTTFDSLYAIESRTLNAKTSLSLFARLDIGLIMNEDTKRFEYFVNEVERTATASLWTNNSRQSQTESPIGTFGSTFAEMLYNWIKEIKCPGVV